MVNKSTHPEIQLFEHLNGAADAATAQTISEHLNSCEECASVAAIVRTMKRAALEPDLDQNQDSDNHPDISELASFFYAEPAQPVDSRVAVHLALCDNCAQSIALYASSEAAASTYASAKVANGEVPARAWELIEDWEDSSFAKPKLAGEVLGQELLKTLFNVLAERTQAGESTDESSGSPDPARVPVLIVSSSGEVTGVEFFESVKDSTGARVFRHAGGSQRFDNKLVHALLDYGDASPILISESIKVDTIRLEHATREEEKLRRVDYFILEH